MERTPTRRGLAALSVAAGLLAASAASAHPHMWIDARAVIDLDADKRITAVRQVWRFDEMFGAYATQGLKRGKDGSLSADTRAGMARDWMKALGEPISHYFTRVSVDGKSAAFAAPRDARVDWDAKAGRLSLAFTLPLAEPMALGADGAQIDIYDPTYFVAYAFDERTRSRWRAAGRGLQPGLPQAQGTGLEDHAAVGRDSGRPGRAAGRTVRHHQGPDASHRGPLPVMRPAGTLRAWSRSWRSRWRRCWRGRGRPGHSPRILSACPRAAAAWRARAGWRASSARSRPGRRTLPSADRRGAGLAGRGGAAWALAGLSFAYGVFHALGPGHGKAVISSYVLANRQTARNGALLALLSSLIQALVAIALVAVLALVFDATAAVMNQATRWLELASYALVTLLGVWLVWLKALRPLLRRRADARRTAPPAVQAPAASPPKGAAALRAIAVRVSAPGGQGHATTHHHEHDHVHHEDCGCGHAHAPAAEQVAGPMNWRRRVGHPGGRAAALQRRADRAGLSLSQGFFAAGIASALAMGLGTG